MYSSPLLPAEQAPILVVHPATDPRSSLDRCAHGGTVAAAWQALCYHATSRLPRLPPNISKLLPLGTHRSSIGTACVFILRALSRG